MRALIRRWAWIPLFLVSGALLLAFKPNDALWEVPMILPALLGTILVVSAYSRHEEKRLQDMTKGERLGLAAAAMLAAATLLVSRWSDPATQYYLHRFDPLETAAILVLGIGSLAWTVYNAPKR